MISACEFISIPEWLADWGFVVQNLVQGGLLGL